MRQRIGIRRRRAPAGRPRGFWRQQVPWFWTGFVLQTGLRPWVPATAVTLFFFLPAMFISRSIGDLNQFLADPRWYVMAIACGAVAYFLASLPRGLDRLWEGLRPWLVNEAAAKTFWLTAPIQIMRFFWPAWGFWILVIGPGALNPASDPLGKDFSNPAAFQPFNIGVSILGTYLLAAATSPAIAGLALFAKDLAKKVDLKRGFVPGGKAAFAPFNRLLLTVWLTYTIPVALITAARTSLIGETNPGSMVAGIVFGAVLIMLTMFLPHLFINRLLAKEKERELHQLRQDMSGAAAVGGTTATAEGTRRTLRMQALMDQQQQTLGFNPTLMDARFFIQFAASATAIVMANVLLQQLL